MTEASPAEAVLTDDEKAALLDGVSSGEVEVHSAAGRSYAVVEPFEIGPRSHILTDSYPRLESLNNLFAGRVGKKLGALLNAESVVEFSHNETCIYDDFNERLDSLSLLLEFAPKPLAGSALVSLDAELIEVLVETFYGGTGNEPSRRAVTFFTPGEVNVATLFGGVVVETVGDVWQSLAQLKPELLRPHLNNGVIDCIEGGDTVIAVEFTLTVAEKTQRFHVLWPMSTVVSLLPVFEGQKRERDAEEDARWGRALRARVVDSTVTISSRVGNTRLPLGEIADWSPGDIVPIADPQTSTVYSKHVPVFEGRFGLHDGRHAIETTQWLEPHATAAPAYRR